jgi:DNA-binding NarL/FixJ family response regulator
VRLGHGATLYATLRKGEKRVDKIRIFVADDHPLVLEGMLLLLEGPFEIVGKAANGVGLLAYDDQPPPDVYVIDVNMPGVGGFEAARQLLNRKPDAKILFFSGHCSAAVINESFKTGGLGFVSKFADGNEVASAITTVAKGDKFIGSDAQQEIQKHGENVLLSLTPRQVSVLQLIAEGLTAKEIATRLGLSPRTAEFHRQCIMERLDLHSTAELTRFAIQSGLMPSEGYRSQATHAASNS